MFSYLVWVLVIGYVTFTTSSLSWKCMICVFFSVYVLHQQRRKIQHPSFLLQRRREESAFRTFCLPCKGECCDRICKMRDIFADKRKAKLEERLLTTNKTLGRGIPSSANIQGNSTPNPRVPGYPLNCIIFLNNLSERLVR